MLTIRRIKLWSGIALVLMFFAFWQVEVRASVWELKILEIKVVKELHTTKTVKMENEEEKQEEYENYPIEGCCYAICSIQMEKTILGENSMDSSKLCLHIGEEVYERSRDDGFLANHNFSPIKQEVMIGGFGQVCFEIPDDYLETKDFSDWYISCEQFVSDRWTYGNSLVPKLLSPIGQTEAMEQDLLAGYEKEKGDLAHAYLRLNPYGNAPLTAAVLFETDEACDVEVTVLGKDHGQEISYKNEEITTDHYVGIFGLYPDYENHVLIKAGKEYREFLIQTDQVPPNMTGIQKEKLCDSSESVLDNQLYLLHDGWYTIIDQEGEIRWYLSEKWHTDSVSGAFTMDKENNGFWFSYGIANGSPYRNGAQFTHINWFGKLDKAYSFADYCAHHSADLLPDGSILYYAGHDGARNDILKLNPETGEKSVFLDLNQQTWLDKDVGNLNPRTKEEEDWLHPNSIQYVEEENCLLLSFRNQHMLACLDFDSLEPKWILTSALTENNEGEIEPIQKGTMPYLLLPEENFDWFYTQHDLRYIAGTDSVMDVTLFDNGSARYVGMETDEELDKRTDLRYSRMLRLRLNLEKRTVSKVFDYGKEAGVRLYSKTFGSTVYIPENGHYLGSFAGQNKIMIKDSYIAEVDGEGKLVAGFTLSGIKEGNYQAEPVYLNKLNFMLHMGGENKEIHEYAVDHWTPYTLPKEDAVVKYEAFHVARLVKDEDTVTIYGRGLLAKDKQVKAALLAVQNERSEVFSFPMAALQYSGGGFLGAGIPFTGLPHGNYILYVISYGENGDIAAVKINQRLLLDKDYVVKEE